MTDKQRPYFSRLKVEGFRRLKNFDLELRPFTVLIGANGVGKSTLLDAWTLLSRSAKGELGQTVSDFQGINSMSSGSDAIKTNFSFSAEYKNIVLTYGLFLSKTSLGFEVWGEFLNQDRSRYIEPKKDSLHNLFTSENKFNFNELSSVIRDDNNQETAFSQVGKFDRVLEEFRKELATVLFYHTLEIGPRSPIRLPQQLRPATLPGANGEDLISCLFSIRESNRDSFEAIEDALRAGFPGFERLEFPPVAAGMLALAWRDKNFKQPLYMHQLSEGTLRFLWLVTLLYSPGLTAVTLIDEPEVSLHPELLSLLVDLFRDASRRTQLIVATHSDRFVRFLKPEEIVAMDLDEEGWAHAKWGDELDLEKWLSDYTLDQLWSMGELGARSS